MIDIVNQINATHRELGTMPVAGEDGRSLLLRRTYDAPIDVVWDACTSPERLARWLGPVSGDLRLGGNFQLESNASGEILRCEQPHLIKTTWSYGGGMDTEVEVRLSSSPEGTVLELEHSTPAAILDELVKAYGVGGTIGVGGGWELTVLALDLYVRGVEFDPSTWEDTDEAKAFATQSCHEWGSVIQEAWDVSDDDIAAAIEFGVQQLTEWAAGPTGSEDRAE